MNTSDLIQQIREAIAPTITQHQINLINAVKEIQSPTQKGPVRLGLVVHSVQELSTYLNQVLDVLEKGKPQENTADIFLRHTDQELSIPKIAFMFAGQGAQRLGLMKWFLQSYPAFSHHLESLAAAADSLLPKPLLDYLYPAETQIDLQQAEQDLQATQVCQPVMVALGLALADFLKELGITPSMCLGHSLGEFAAASCGGILTPAATVNLVAERGRLMAEYVIGDCGLMAAVKAPADQVKPHLAEGAVIANLNHPLQTVISGTTAGIETSMQNLKRARIVARAIRVSHAFHSPLMRAVQEPLDNLLRKTTLHAPTLPVVSAITGNVYPDDLQKIHSLFCQHALAPVNFMAALQSAKKLGADVFIQLGAGTTLTEFAKDTLGEQLPIMTLADTKNDNPEIFFHTLARLWVLGQNIKVAMTHTQ